MMINENKVYDKMAKMYSEKVYEKIKHSPSQGIKNFSSGSVNITFSEDSFKYFIYSIYKKGIDDILEVI